MSLINHEFSVSQDALHFDPAPVVRVEYNERVVDQEFAHLYAIGEDIERTRASADMSKVFPERKTGLRSVVVAFINLQFPKTAKNVEERDLIEIESHIGAEIVDNENAVEERRFFYEKDHNWFYVQIFNDGKGVENIQGTRYEVNDTHVLRIINGSEHTPIGRDEMQRFSLATSEYHKRIMREVYQQDPTAQPLGKLSQFPNVSTQSDRLAA